MKRKLYLFTALLLALLSVSSTRTTAQINYVSVDSNTVFSQTSCALPAPSYISYMVNVQGSVPLTFSNTLLFYINFGDGTDTTFTDTLSWTSGIYGGVQNYMVHNYTIAGTFNVLVSATVPTNPSVTDTTLSNAITLTTSCQPLSGQLYFDNNSNCMHDAGEAVLSYHVLAITNNTTNNVLYTLADANGNYSINLPVSYSYTIAPAYASTLMPVCTTTGYNQVTVNPAGTYVRDFAFACTPGGTPDASVAGWASGWRPGFNRIMTLHAVTNNYCNNIPATVTLTLDPLLSYASTQLAGTIPPTSISGNTLTWNVASLNASSSFTNGLNIYCSPSAILGDTLCVTLNITTTPPDANPLNNTYVICAPVNNSFDPNDKNVSPKGTGPTGNIANGTELTYLINFQNTGNDVAYDVTVRDSIDSDLDMSTLQVIRTSHTMKPFVASGREVAFRFENINLPDSGANEPASHGYIVYKIKPKAGLAVGTQLKNTARIYFDFNSAIVTNTTLNTIALPTAVQHFTSGDLSASVYPNPATNNIYIEIKDQQQFSAELYDITGRAVTTVKGTSGRASLNVKELAAGIYMLRLSCADKTLSTKITIEH